MFPMVTMPDTPNLNARYHTFALKSAQQAVDFWFRGTK
jgi:hypothetical protein